MNETSIVERRQISRPTQEDYLRVTYKVRIER
jgi:hypothetical protein